jgi:hypothetical protein
MSVMQPYGAAPKGSARRGLLIALIASGLVVCCCVGGVLIFGRTALEIKPARAAADAYVGAVVAGDDARAFQYVCTASDSRSHHDAFTSRVRGENASSHRVVNTTISIRNLLWVRATVFVELIGSSGPIETVTLPMGKEGGKWKVCNS